MHSHGDRRLGEAAALTAALLVLEIAGGLAGGSLALLSDAGHVVTDLAAIGLAWVAAVQARRPADVRRTYGYQRAGILAALGNASLLLVVVLVVGYEAARRLVSPPPVEAGLTTAVALAGAALNVVILARIGGFHGGANLRAVALHVGGDLLGAAAVVAAGLVMLLTGWRAADPLASLLIAVLIAVGAFRLVRETLDVLMESVPRGLDLNAVERELLAAPGVEGVHDLHVWTLAEHDVALSAHLVVPGPATSLATSEHMVAALAERLRSGFGIGHATIQVESCHPCQEPAH